AFIWTREPDCCSACRLVRPVRLAAAASRMARNRRAPRDPLLISGKPRHSAFRPRRRRVPRGTRGRWGSLPPPKHQASEPLDSTDRSRHWPEWLKSERISVIVGFLLSSEPASLWNDVIVSRVSG